jgi:hypothetical protein
MEKGFSGIGGGRADGGGQVAGRLGIKAFFLVSLLKL